jgi:ribonuclease R
VLVLRVAGRDEYGDFYGITATNDSQDEESSQRILITGSKHAPGIGDKLLARIETASPASDGYRWQARPVKILKEHSRPDYFLGVFHTTDEHTGIITPVDKKYLRDWEVDKAGRNRAEDGELVGFQPVKTGRYGHKKARIIKRFVNSKAAYSLSTIAIHKHEIPHEFPPEVVKELEELPPLSLAGRKDLRELPLVTIDPPDARDHDDAVWAGTDPSPENSGGFIIVIAIADVSYYVRPGTAIDREAFRRGNSVYFPDQVVPMLPEKISNDLCSLRENEDRPCVSVEMVFDKEGRKLRHSFFQAIMRSCAKLSYEEAQAAIDGQLSEKTAPLLENLLKPLWQAYAVLSKARGIRQPLDLEMPERKIVLDTDGNIADITIPDRLDAHELIEEFMIQANVSAAETLDKQRYPVVYRTHEPPSAEKISSLSDVLKTIGIKLPPGDVIKTARLNRILELTKGTEHASLVQEIVLRSMSQAEYSTENPGHFGLNLRRYVHFTSPIRRYADLLVHRILTDSATVTDLEQMSEIAKRISNHERRAMAAERETIDRFTASYMAEHENATFSGRLAGLSRSGIFVRLDDTGADGFVPASSIGDEYFFYDERHQAMVGDLSGAAYKLGDRVKVRIAEVIPTAGAIRLELLSRPDTTSKIKYRKTTSGKTGRKSRYKNRGRR